MQIENEAIRGENIILQSNNKERMWLGVIVIVKQALLTIHSKYWLEYAYLARILSFTKTNVTTKTATAAYLTELSAAMNDCVGNKRHSAKLTHVQKKFGTIKKVSIAINNYLNCVININDDAKCGS